jgi:D-3-phosphoglycerate dehydrogenase
MMAVARNIGDADASIKAGKWERSRLTGIEAKGKTLGIIGLGKGMFQAKFKPEVTHPC